MEFRRDYPSAALKGFTWGAYEKEKAGEERQPTLFEEGNPFE